jgi:tRNA nucleotidyltransferase (CCA-adding enzyme)
VVDEAELLARAVALPGVGRLAGCAGLHLVGGAVRDLLRGAVPEDLDFVVEGDPRPAAARLGGPLIAHDRFGTVAVRVDGRTYDFARARAERYPAPGALPEVRPAAIEEDLARRDFTVNTFALALGPPEPGRLRSVPGAREDLAAGRLRVLHDGSFRDDPTRLLRLGRYRARLGFQLEPRTRALAEAAVREGALDTVSGPRIGAELRLLLRAPEVLDGFAVLGELGLDAAIAPGFGLRGELAERALALLPADGRRDLLVLAVACRDVADLRALLERLAFRTPEVRTVLTALDVPCGLTGASPGAAAELLRTPEQAALAGALGAEPEARHWLEATRFVELAITGEDLLAAGVPEGPALGAALRATLRRKRDGELPGGRAAELAAAVAEARRIPVR